jgi:hypothetical protein
MDAQTAVAAALRGLTAPKSAAAPSSPKSAPTAAAAAELEATTISLAKSCASRAMANLPGTGGADISPMGTPTPQPMGSSTHISNSGNSGVAGKKGNKKGRRGGKKNRKGGNKVGSKAGKDTPA